MAESRTFTADPTAGLNPEDYQYFRGAKWRINDTYGLGLAQNEFQQNTARNAYSRQTGDLARQFAQMREKLPGSFTQRGLLNSGLYQKALGQFGIERQAATANLAGGFQDTMAGYGLARQQLDATRTNALADVESQEAARRAAVAAALRAAQF